MRAAIRNLILVAVSLLAAALIASASRPPAAPALFLNPPIGIPGTYVKALGSDFTSGMDVSLLWDGVSSVGTGVVDDDGRVTITFRVPGSAAQGMHTVVLCALCGQDFETASARFQVLPAPTATFTCEQMLSCTWTPTYTAEPPTPTSTPSPTPFGFVASDTPSATAPDTPTPPSTGTQPPTATPTATAGRAGGVGLLLVAGGLLILGSAVGLLLILLRRQRV
jgi:hypothetical protein